MQSAEDHFRAAGAIPVGQFVGALGESQMHGDADDLRHRIERRPAVEQVFVPVLDAPVRGRGRGEAGQGQASA